MQIFSRREWEFLCDPDKFSDGHQRVLRNRLRKKARAMEWALMFMESCPKAMLPARDYEKVWQDHKSKAVYAMFHSALYEVANTPEHRKFYNEASELLRRLKDLNMEEDYDTWYRAKYSYWIKVIALRDKLKKSNQPANTICSIC